MASYEDRIFHFSIILDNMVLLSFFLSRGYQQDIMTRKTLFAFSVFNTNRILIYQFGSHLSNLNEVQRE